MKLVKVESDKQYTYEHELPVRYHRLFLREVIGEFNLRRVAFDLNPVMRYNASPYGGVEAAHLMFQEIKWERKEDCEEIRVELRESPVKSFADPFRVLIAATGEIQEFNNGYKPFEFRDLLPTCPDFEPATEFTMA